MKSFGTVKVSIYDGIFDTTSRYTITIDAALERIRTGHSQKVITLLRAETNENRQRQIKDKLPSVTYSGIFSEREDEKIITHSGFLCLDFDEVGVSEYIEKFKEWPHTFACWTSPSGTGVKVLLRIANTKKHREHFTALKKEFTNADPKCINESRVCYESYDPNIYINQEAKVYTTVIKFEVVEDKKVTTDTFDIYKRLVKWTETSTKSDKSYHNGNRNYFAYILAGAMCRYGINEDDTSILIVTDYSQTDFQKKEIDRSIKSAYKKNRASFGTVEFSNSKLYTKETKYEINPDVLLDGYRPEDIIYGSDVYDEAIDIYEHGYKSAETTRIPKLDEYWKWKRGEITLISGIGNYGKSLYAYHLMLIKALYDNHKFAVFSPEHFPAGEFYFDFTEMLLGQPCNGGYHSKPSRKTFDTAYEFVSNHFFFTYPESIAPSPEFIKTKFLELILSEKVDGVVIDPFNQLANDYSGTGGRSDKYLETFLADCKRFAQENNIYFLIIAHPTKLKKESDGNYPCPDVFDLSDGAMWNNKCDNILVYHRPLAQTDPDAPICEHHSKKIKRQKMIGKRGFFDFEYNRPKRRFYFNGFNPLDSNRFEQGSPKLNAEQAAIDINPDKFTEPDKDNYPF